MSRAKRENPGRPVHIQIWDSISRSGIPYPDLEFHIQIWNSYPDLEFHIQIWNPKSGYGKNQLESNRVFETIVDVSFGAQMSTSGCFSWALFFPARAHQIRAGPRTVNSKSNSRALNMINTINMINMIPSQPASQPASQRA